MNKWEEHLAKCGLSDQSSQEETTTQYANKWEEHLAKCGLNDQQQEEKTTQSNSREELKAVQQQTEEKQKSTAFDPLEQDVASEAKSAASRVKASDIVLSAVRNTGNTGTGSVVTKTKALKEALAADSTEKTKQNAKTDLTEDETEEETEKTAEVETEEKDGRLANIVKSAGAGASAAAGEIYGQLLGLSAAVTKARESLGDDSGRIAEQYEKVKELQEKVQDKAMDIGQESGEYSENAREGLGLAGQIGVDLGINALNMAGDAAFAAATGGSSLLPMAVRSYGQSAQKARAEGGSVYDQVVYGAGKAAVEVLTEKMSSIAAPLKKIYGVGAVDDVVEKLISSVGNKYGQTGLKLLASAAGEGLEEVVSGVIDPLLQQATYNQDATLDVGEVAYDAAVGAIMGGIMGLPGSVVKTATNANTATDARTATTQAASEVQTAANMTANAEKGSLLASEKVRTDSLLAPETKTDVLEVDIQEMAAKGNAAENNAQQSAGEVAESAVDFDESGHTTQEIETIREYKQAVDPDVLEFVERHIANPQQKNERQKISNVNTKQAKAIQELIGLDVSDYTNTLSSQNFAQHIWRRHGENGVADSSMANTEDIARVGYVLENFDSIDFVKNPDGTLDYSEEYSDRNNSRAPKIKFTKKIDGTYSVVEAVPDSKWKKLWVVSMYMTKDSNTVSRAPNAKAPEDTSKTPHAATDVAAVNSISQKQEAVNAMDVLETDIKDVGAAKAGFDPYTNALNRYGAIEPGADPVRVVDVPKQMTDDTKVSQAARTIMEAEMTPDSAIPALEQAVVDGGFSHMVVTDEAAAANARSVIEFKGWDSALADWTAEVRSGKISKNNVALGAELYNNAINSGNTKTAVDIMIDIASMGTTGAQVTQAMAMLKSLSPEMQLYGVQKSIAKLEMEINEKYKGKKNVEIKVDQELYDNFLKADSEDARGDALEAVYKQVAKQVPNTFADTWNAWRYFAMLSNPRTHVRNVTSNAAFTAVRGVADDISTAAQYALPKESREQSFLNPLLSQDLALKEAAKADVANVEDALSGGGKYNDIRDNIDKYRNKFGDNVVGRKLNAAAEFNSNALDVEDTWFSKPAYVKYLSRYLKAKGITAEQFQSMTDVEKSEARGYAVEKALEAVFRDKNPVSELVNKTGKNYDGNSLAGKAANAMVEGILPFKRTPANILVRSVEYSPLGFVKAVHDGIQSAGGNDVSVAAVIDSVAKAATGSGLMLLGSKLYDMGVLTSTEDDLEKLQGHQNYAIEIDGHSYTITNFAPSVATMLTGAEMARMLEDGELKGGDIINLISTISDPVAETTMLSSLRDALSNDPYSDENEIIQFAAKAGLSYLGQGYPQALSTVANIMDGTRRTAYSTKSGVAKEADIWLQGLKNKTPILRESSTPYVDRWGRTEENESIVARTVENTISPGFYSKIQSSAMEDEIRRVMDATGSDVMPKYAPKKDTYDKQSRILTAEENARYQTTMGQSTYDLYTQITEMDGYKALSDENKLTVLQKARSYSEKLARQELWGEGFKDDELDELTESGLDPALALLAGVVTSKTNMPGEKDENGETITLSRTAQVAEYVDGLDLSDGEKAVMLAYLGQDNTQRAVDAVDAGMSFGEYRSVLDATAGGGGNYEIFNAVAETNADSDGKFEYCIAHVSSSRETLQQAQKAGFDFDQWAQWQNALKTELDGSGKTDEQREYISSCDWKDEQKVFAATKAGLMTKSMETLMNLGADFDQATAAKEESDIAATLIELGHDVGTACVIASGLTDVGGKAAQRQAVYDVVEENGYDRDVLEDAIVAVNRQDSAAKIEGGDSAFSVLDNEIADALMSLQRESDDFELTRLLPAVGDMASVDGVTYTYDERDVEDWKTGYRAVYDLVDGSAFNDAEVADKIDSWAAETAKFFALWDEQGAAREDVPSCYLKLYVAMNSGFTAEEYTKAYIIKGQAGTKANTLEAWWQAGYNESQISALWSILG